MKILVSYRGIPQSPGWATGDLVVKAFRQLGHQVFPYAKYYQENRWVDGRPALDEHDWDLILFLECNDGDPQYTELRVTKAKHKACWLFDSSYHQDQYRGLVNYFEFDHIFLANPLTIRQYKVWGCSDDRIHYLPYACDRELHGRPLDYPKTRDIVLVGSVREDRIKLQKDLAKQGINLELIGNVFREQYIDTLASAKIVINQNPEAGRGLLNMRFFEAPAAGAILFTEHIDNECNLTCGLQPVAFPYESLAEAGAFIKQFVSQPEHLLDMRRVAQERVFEYHTYDNRCRMLLETIF